MLTFYLIAGGLAVLAAGLLIRPLIARRADENRAQNRDARDAQVFRDQLDELERDLARGTITAEEAEGARIEISRRLIAADARARSRAAPRPAPQGHSGLAAGLALIGTPALAAALYLAIGAPGVPDRPFAERQELAAGLGDGGGAARPSQAEAEAQMAGQLPPPQDVDPQYAELVSRLEQTVAARPDDVRGQRLLANSLMQLGRFAEAWRAYHRVIELSGGSAGAEIHAAKAEGMILAAGGYVSPEAADEIAAALERDPGLPMGRYYAGVALRQAGRLDDAIAVWEGLRRDSPPDAPYLEWVDAMLAEAGAARDASLGAPGAPGGAEMPGAERLSPEERATMIEGMVARLDARLSSQGGSVEEWARLVASYASLGRHDDARAAFERGLAALGPGPQADALRVQAGGLGIVGEAPPDGAAAPARSNAAPGPTEDQVAAAARMSLEDRAAMIEGMVARLEERLTTDGGTAEEWLRLIRSFVQLDRPEDAERAYRLAAAALADDPSAGFVKEQAMLMGVAVE